MAALILVFKGPCSIAKMPVTDSLLSKLSSNGLTTRNLHVHC